VQSDPIRGGSGDTVVVYEPHGFVQLEAHCASDLSVVNAARVSFAKHSKEYSGRDEKLVRFLMTKRHGTPFEHNYMRFHVRAPIFVFWDWKRHRIASYNVESARYVELRPDFYFPERARTQQGNPGDYYFEDASEDQTSWLVDNLEEYCDLGWQKYQAALDNGIAKEQARVFLPMNLYIEFYFSCNARSLMNFLSLRNSNEAIEEIHSYAAAIEQLWEGVMPDTAKAFKENGSVAP
jgi:thymidylate synthase (FAD)